MPKDRGSKGCVNVLSSCIWFVLISGIVIIKKGEIVEDLWCFDDDQRAQKSSDKSDHKFRNIGGVNAHFIYTQLVVACLNLDLRYCIVIIKKGEIVDANAFGVLMMIMMKKSK